MSYLALKHLHVTCAVLSISLFILRGGLLLAGQNWREQARWRWLRWLPHANDTVLLAAAIALALWSQQYPLQQPWLTAKVLALLVYIGLGQQALRPGLPRHRRTLWLAAAWASAVYIVVVAISRQPLPWLA